MSSKGDAKSDPIDHILLRDGVYKQFAAYTTQQLQEFGLSFGMMYFVIYVGKHPGCTPAEMTKNLHLDWGHCQRSDQAGGRWLYDPGKAGPQLSFGADPGG